MALTFKEIYCSDCKTVLARYSTKYFTDTDINGDDLVFTQRRAP